MTKNIQTFHNTIDDQVKRLEQHHSSRLNCQKGCSDCCVDDITVFNVEADLIRQNHPDLLRTGKPAAKGRCAFLNEQGACRVYYHRPYVCRTQGLPLRWTEEDNWEIVEYRDICPLNEAGPPVESLPEEVCWTLGPSEAQLAQIQREHGRQGRVSLRSLFSEQDSK